MHRSTVPLSLAIGLVCAGIAGCLSDLEDLCQTDADCPAGGRCAVEDGFRYCIPGPGAGGNGGTGGVGGSGGGAAEFEAIVDLELLPDEELADFLERIPRRVDAVTLHYLSGGGERTVKVPLEEPSALPLASLTLRLPLASQSEALTIDVTAHVTLKNDEPGTLATGQLDAEFAADQTHPVSVRLSLNHDFDWDGDDDPDITDCGPDDPAVHHGAIDFCDGTQQACGQSYCYIPLEPGQTVRDLACSATERKCAAVITNGETSVVRIYETEILDELAQISGVTKAKGITWNTSGGETSLIIIEPKFVSFSNPTGELLAGQLESSVELSGSISTSNHGNIAAAPGNAPLTLVTFDPSRASSLSRRTLCDTSGSECNTLVLEDLFTRSPSPLPPGSLISHAEIYRLVAVGSIGINLQFTEEEKIGFLQLNSSRTIEEDESGLLDSLPTGSKLRFISSFGTADKLFAAFRGEFSWNAVWLTKGLSLDGHGEPVPVELPTGSCPSALDAARTDSSLFMADDCTGSLWELPLDEEGRPTGAEPIHHPLGDECKKPFKLASLPAAGDEKALTFVGCEGESHILVHNRN